MQFSLIKKTLTKICKKMTTANNGKIQVTQSSSIYEKRMISIYGYVSCYSEVYSEPCQKSKIKPFA